MMQMGRLKAQKNALDEENPMAVFQSCSEVCSQRYRVKC